MLSNTIALFFFLKFSFLNRTPRILTAFFKRGMFEFRYSAPFYRVPYDHGSRVSRTKNRTLMQAAMYRKFKKRTKIRREFGSSKVVMWRPFGSIEAGFGS